MSCLLFPEGLWELAPQHFTVITFFAMVFVPEEDCINNLFGPGLSRQAKAVAARGERLIRPTKQDGVHQLVGGNEEALSIAEVLPTF